MTRLEITQKIHLEAQPLFKVSDARQKELSSVSQAFIESCSNEMRKGIVNLIEKYCVEQKSENEFTFTNIKELNKKQQAQFRLEILNLQAVLYLMVYNSSRTGWNLEDEDGKIRRYSFNNENVFIMLKLVGDLLKESLKELEDINEPTLANGVLGISNVVKELSTLPGKQIKNINTSIPEPRYHYVDDGYSEGTNAPAIILGVGVTLMTGIILVATGGTAAVVIGAVILGGLGLAGLVTGVTKLVNEIHNSNLESENHAKKDKWRNEVDELESEFVDNLDNMKENVMSLQTKAANLSEECQPLNKDMSKMRRVLSESQESEIENVDQHKVYSTIRKKHIEKQNNIESSPTYDVENQDGKRHEPK